MDTLDAVMIIEENHGSYDEELYIKAWQFLIDNGVVWQLQGSYQRGANSLIAQGLCTARKG